MKYRSQIDWLYIAQGISHPEYVKVGWTTDPQQRFKALFHGKEISGKIRYLRAFPEHMGRIYEKKMHEYLADAHYTGEWFKIPVQDAINAMHNVDWYFSNIEKRNLEVDKKYSEIVKKVLDTVLSY